MQIKIFNSRKLNETREFNLVLATSNLKKECFIGRSPASSLVLDSPDVSRLHGKLLQQSGNYYFIDIGSRNGSIVNGKLAEINQKYQLKPGDVVRIGEFVLILEEMDVIRQDLAETVFGSVASTATAIGVKDTTEISNREISIPPEATESPLTAETTQKNEVSASIATENTLIQVDTNEITFDEEEATFIQISLPPVDEIVVQSPAIKSDRETIRFTEPPIELDIFATSDALTEAELTSINDRPTHIEVFEQPEVVENEILVPDPWQDLELESESSVFDSSKILELDSTLDALTKGVATVSQKYIALMAHDRQKPELAEFVGRHQAFFAKYLTIATPTTSATLHHVGLEVSAETPALPIGGYQAIANLVNSGNILAVILLEDMLQLPESERENEAALMRACNLNQVLLATNLTTAAAILSYLDG